jgi:hypothetical protein
MIRIEEMRSEVFDSTTKFTLSTRKNKTEPFDLKNPSNPKAFNPKNPINNDWGFKGFYRTTQNWMGHNYFRLTLVV